MNPDRAEPVEPTRHNLRRRYVLSRMIDWVDVYFARRAPYRTCRNCAEPVAAAGEFARWVHVETGSLRCDPDQHPRVLGPEAEVDPVHEHTRRPSR